MAADHAPASRRPGPSRTPTPASSSATPTGRRSPASTLRIGGDWDGGPLVTDVDPAALRKKEINGPIRLPKRDFFTRGQKLKVKDPWHIILLRSGIRRHVDT